MVVWRAGAADTGTDPGVGREVNGSQRWLPWAHYIAAVGVGQLAVVVYLAGYMVRREDEVRYQWQGFLPMTVLFATTLLLLIGQDFGATVIVAATAFGMLFLPASRWAISWCGAGARRAAGAGCVQPYRVALAATPILGDPYNTGFQLPSPDRLRPRRVAGRWPRHSVQGCSTEAHRLVFFDLGGETGFVSALTVIAYLPLIGGFCDGPQGAAGGNPFGAYICYGVAWCSPTVCEYG